MSSERRKPYPFDQIEPKWQQIWEERQLFHAPNPGDPQFDSAKPKFYVLDMFPYPSGAGLHVGHPEGYTATDIIARYKRLRGFNVLHPMGWDAFGLPAEQYAIKTGQHPALTTRENVAKFKSQLQRIGFSYDWQREINTTDPRYFKWTQWIFLQLYNSWFNFETNKAEPITTYKGDDPDRVRLAYVAEVPVNWCPELGTVLANEEVIDGRSEIGGHPVVRRPMRQWMLRITAYAERLINELDGLDWPESIKLLQRNWIGKSEGAEIDFKVAQVCDLRTATEGNLESCPTLKVFSTRPDTLYGATYMVLAPEHSLVDQIVAEEQWPELRAYRERTARKSDLERTELSKEKTGVSTGAYATNPVNGEKIPIWIADYVLVGYGTGAIMGVPGHDERDLEFARKFDLPIVPVVQEPGKSSEGSIGFVGDGIAINSPIIDGLPTPDAKRKIIQWLTDNDLGRANVNYKLRDWLFSRQRYWGEPFPIVWESEPNGQHRKHRALDATELPVVPPPLEDYKPTGTGEPPLAKAKEWIRYSEKATRETNVMPQWAGSCWYYLRFCDPQNDDRFVGEEAERYWMGAVGSYSRVQGLGMSTETRNLKPETLAKPGGVDLYVGGTEHAVLHLLYARFWHKVLFDLGYLFKPEPFQRLVNQGIILGEDNQKMSKSRGNIVNPDEVIDAYGADAFRCYEMFMGPLEQMKPWSMRGVEGVARFLARVWRLMMRENQAGEWELSPAVRSVEVTKPQRKVLHATIKKVTDDIETLSFNTAISQMMIFVNAFIPQSEADVVPISAMRPFLVLLNPFAPHLSSELWQRLGSTTDITEQPWPTYDEDVLTEEEVEIVLQINGKVKAHLTVSAAATEDQINTAALEHPKIKEALTGKHVRKVVVVPKKLVNIVAG
jgi:leucyl-tRNA synthetase